MNSVKYRQQHKVRIVKKGTFTFDGYAPTSVGSMNVPVVGSHDESRKPFAPMPGITAQKPRSLRGGFPFLALASLLPSVISAFTGKGKKVKGGIRDMKNYGKVKSLLKQRANDMNFQDNPEAPPSVAPEALTEDDKYKIELNQLLTRISDLVEVGDTDPLTADVWRRAIALLAQTAPFYDAGTMSDMVEYWETMVQTINATIAEKGDDAERLDGSIFTRRSTIEAIYKYVVEMAGLMDRSENERVLASKSFLKQMGITQPTAKKILSDARQSADEYYSRYIAPGVERRAEEERLGAEEEEADGEEGRAEAEEEEVDEADEGIGAQQSALALRRLDRLYRASPKGAGDASDELMELFRIVFPASRVRRGALQVRNALRPILEDPSDDNFDELSTALAELSPAV